MAEAEPAQALGTFTLEQASRRDSKNPVSLSWDVDDWSWASDGKTLRKGRGEAVEYYDALSGEAAPAPAESEAASGGSRTNRDRRTARIVDLARSGGVELPVLSPDGKKLAFIRDYDLFVASMNGGDPRALTEGGSREYLNGKLDWVYQEEVYGRGDFQGFWWSPTGTHIAYLCLDESNVKDFTVIDHIEDDHFRVKPELTRYPKVGDPNPITKVGIVEVASGETTWLDLSRFPSDLLAVRVSWTPAGDRCLVAIQDRIQTWAELVCADPATGEAPTWIREDSTGWTNRPEAPRWLADGTFLWMSERTGYQHIYHYSAAGELLKPVTQGDWAVTGITKLDEEQGFLRFGATEGGAIDRNQYRVNLDGTGFLRLTQGRGTHAVDFNGDGSLFLDEVSSLNGPAPEVRLCSAEGDILRVLARGVQPVAATHLLSDWELYEVPAEDGTLLDVALLRPVPFDETMSYPVWIQTYSGPDAPSIRNRANGSTWYQFLAQNGMIVMQCNVRTASGKGHWAISQCYERLGEQEVADMADAIDWLVGQPWADASRVGMTGYSFGGFMTASSMIFTDKIRLGIAGGGVYDWRMYDSIYTERYMATPRTNLAGYDSTSPIEHAAKLKGFLHMHHGVMDDNVHLQNMLQMSYALMKAGRTNFSTMTYPQTRHGIRDPEMAWHARQHEWRLIQEHLQPPYTLGLEEARAMADFDAALK